MLNLELELPHGLSGAAGEIVRDLPGGIVLIERAAQILRAWLRERNLDDWRVFYEPWASFADVDEFLPQLDEHAKWMTISALSGRGEALDVAYVDTRCESLKHQPPGVLHLHRHRIVLARWNWREALDGAWKIVRLCAAPEVADLNHLRSRLVELRRIRERPQWQIFEASAWDDTTVDRDMSAEDGLVLSDDLRRLAEENLVRFFSEESAALYRALRVPYRRGVLLYGAPGNGKTSLVRWVGSRLPQIPFLLLRAGNGFESGDLRELFRRWREQMPAVLVVEDLNWMFKQVELSTFLNLLDGVVQPANAGLLLIGTTNHPHELDSAISNRPGRFDLAIEFPSPDAALRRRYFQSRGDADLNDAELDQLVSGTDGLSFAHLQEVLQRAGLFALRESRSRRTAADLLAAAVAVRGGHDQAISGFPRKGEMPFGLHHLHQMRKRNM